MRVQMGLAAGFALACSLSASAGADSRAEERVRQAEIDLADLSDIAGGIPRANSCGSAPLSTTPSGPRNVTNWKRLSSGTDLAKVTAWRIPCSSTESMVVVTLEPIPGHSETFVCTSSITLLQAGGLQTNNFDFRNDPPNIGSFCGDVIQPVTVAVLPRSNTPASFDFDQAMTISYNGFNTGHQPIAVPAFDPSQYSLTPPPGPNSVEVYVRGSGTHYRNCSVNQANQGGAIQYTASCNDESPLTFRAFERFDH